MVETIGLERVLGKADFLGVSFLEMALAVSRFVGRINIRSMGPRGLARVRITPVTCCGFGAWRAD